MKKLFLVLLPAFCICMLATSCKKEEENESLKVAKQLEGTWVYETTGSLTGTKTESFTFTFFERAKKFPYINDEVGELAFDGEVRKMYVSSTINTDDTFFFNILSETKTIQLYGRTEDGQHWHLMLPYTETGSYEYCFNLDGTLSLNGQKFTKQE